jgi:hypothetical protein
MLARGLTEDGAAQALGWSKARVTARVKILALPETAQALVGTGEIPVRGIDALLEIQAVSPELAALVAEVVAEAAAEGNALGEQLAHDPGWLVRQVLSHRPGELFAALAGGTLHEDQIAELKLGKKTTAIYAETKTLHGQLDRYAYGPPPVRIGETEIDQGAQERRRDVTRADAARGRRPRAPRAGARVHPPRASCEPRSRRRAARRARDGRPGARKRRRRCCGAAKTRAVALVARRRTDSSAP